MNHSNEQHHSCCVSILTAFNILSFTQRIDGSRKTGNIELIQVVVTLPRLLAVRWP